MGFKLEIKSEVVVEEEVANSEPIVNQPLRKEFLEPYKCNLLVP